MCAKFYSRCKKCKNLRVVGTTSPPLVARRIIILNGEIAQIMCKTLTVKYRWTKSTHSFIHSFITEIYIAPLQGYYSEAFPNLARLKRTILRL